MSPPKDDRQATPPRDVDTRTGEILEPDQGTVPGERSIPSVNRERSMRSRIMGALAAGTVLLVTGGFLVWYYAAEIAHASEARSKARKDELARINGDSTVPPLGPVEPPVPRPSLAASAAVAVLGPPPPVPPTGTFAPPVQHPTAPPPKTPQQLELERQLQQPVMLPAHTPPAPTPMSVSAAPALNFAMPALPGGAGPATTASVSTAAVTLGDALRPTPTPAVAAQVLPTQHLLLPKGSFIDCTLETAIDSTYPGMVTCIGASDVYSADGSVVLLDRGTKYVGETRHEPQQGQARVFVLWTEARTPAGVVVPLASPGTDALGRSGLPGTVDTHFWDRFGAALLISVVDAGVQAIHAAHDSGGAPVVISPQGPRDVMTEVLKHTLDIPPTVVKNQGDRIQVLVARDVDFRSVYALQPAP